MKRKDNLEIETNHPILKFEIQNWENLLFQAFRNHCQQYKKPWSQNEFKVFLLGRDREFEPHEAIPTWCNKLSASNLTAISSSAVG